MGLIFLSAMASSIASACAREGLDAAAALGTALLTMAACTMLTGLGLVAVGERRHAAGSYGLGGMPVHAIIRA